MHLEGFDYVAPVPQGIEGETPGSHGGVTTLGEIPEEASTSFESSGESPTSSTKLVSVEVNASLAEF